MTRRGKIFLVLLILAALTVLGIAFLRSGDEEEVDPQAGGSPSPTATSASPDISPTIIEETETPEAPSSPSTRRGFTRWEGPDDAVSTWTSTKCDREVLQYGSQQYAPGARTSSVPPEVENLGYSNGKKQLWGDRGAPNIVYVTEDGGKTFRTWEATDDSC